MNKKVISIILPFISVLLYSTIAKAHSGVQQNLSALECATDENKISYFVGLDTHADDVTDIEDLATGGEVDANLLLNNFIFHDYENTTSETLDITVDLVAGLISSENIQGAMELLSSSDLSSGKADFSFCSPGNLAPGGILSHVVYFNGSNFIGIHSNTGTITNGVGHSVINASSSDNIGKTFNLADTEGIKGDDRMVRLVEENTVIENSDLSAVDEENAKKKRNYSA
jgi:hypothetical protein